MSKKPEASLLRFGKMHLQHLHSAIQKALDLGDLRKADLRAYCDSASRRAFSGVESYQWFKYWYVQSHILKKYQYGKVSAKARKAQALALLRETEDMCRYTNYWLGNPDVLEWSNALVPLWIRRSLLKARRLAEEILGKFDVELVARHAAFSSGATTEFHRQIGAIPKKWDEGTHITKEALPYAVAFAQTFGRGLKTWRFQVCDGNEVFTVPKNFERDRTCAKEPTWNMFFQKGLGSYMRTKLRKEGLLHPDAQQKHAMLALQASIDGSLTTDDLKSASDCIATSLVRLICPKDWAKALFELRSPVGHISETETVTWEKISSMGNGFTFELETLLFYCLLRAVCGRKGIVSVYGDDLIYPSRHVSQVRELLNFCGFMINTEKSFSDGPFRESCGGHFFRGHNVTPFYIDRLPTTYGEIIELHNNIITYHANMPPSHRWLRVARECRKLIPRKFWGPMGLSGVIWSEWDEARPTYVLRYQAYAVKRVTLVVHKQDHWDYVGLYLQQLWGKSSTIDLPGGFTRGWPLVGQHSSSRITSAVEWATEICDFRPTQLSIPDPGARERVSTCLVWTAR